MRFYLTKTIKRKDYVYFPKGFHYAYFIRIDKQLDDVYCFRRSYATDCKTPYVKTLYLSRNEANRYLKRIWEKEYITPLVVNKNRCVWKVACNYDRAKLHHLYPEKLTLNYLVGK